MYQTPQLEDMSELPDAVGGIGLAIVVLLVGSVMVVRLMVDLPDNVSLFWTSVVVLSYFLALLVAVALLVRIVGEVMGGSGGGGLGRHRGR